MKPTREQRDAYKVAIAAVNALVTTLDEGDDREAAIRVCDDLLTLRYGAIPEPEPA
jgi:hypothetical protein